VKYKPQTVTEKPINIATNLLKPHAPHTRVIQKPINAHPATAIPIIKFITHSFRHLNAFKYSST